MSDALLGDGATSFVPVIAEAGSMDLSKWTDAVIACLAPILSHADLQQIQRTALFRPLKS